MEIRLDGRSALVTGGSKGLGLAMATEFARSGADVAILARDPKTLEAARASVAATAKGRVVAYPCDVGKAEDIAGAWAKVNAELGKIDILVNNAGGSIRGRIEDVTDQMWQDDLDVKFFGAIRFIRLAFPAMKERKWGRIINVLSIAAKAQVGGGAPTEVTRAAGMALTKVVAGEGAPHGVLVNALLVGSIVSDQVVRGHRSRAPDMKFEDYVKMRGEKIPLGRMGRPEEFANIACFLASDAGSYITGTALNVDGGMSPVV